MTAITFMDFVDFWDIRESFPPKISGNSNVTQMAD